MRNTSKRNFVVKIVLMPNVKSAVSGLGVMFVCANLTTTIYGSRTFGLIYAWLNFLPNMDGATPFY